MKEFKEAHGGAPRTLAQEDLLLKDKARANAKSLAFTNLPSATDTSLDAYLKSARAGYESLLTREMKKLPANADLVADLELKSAEQKGVQFHDKLNNARKALHNANLEMSEMEGDDGRHISQIPIWAGIVLIAFGEAFLTFKSVAGLLDVGNNVVSAIILIAFTCLYICIPKALQWYYSEFCEGKRFKAVLYLIPAVILGAGYFTLGYLRSHFMQLQSSMDVNADTNTAPTFIASPYVFVALNFLFLLASYYLASMLPTREQDKYRGEMEKKEKSIEKLEREVEKYEALLGEIPDHGKNNLIRASSSNANRKDMYNQVNSMFLQTCGVFIDTNLQYRTDGIRPKCFDLQIEDLKDTYSNQ